jgi:hypothetical protein
MRPISSASFAPPHADHHEAILRTETNPLLALKNGKALIKALGKQGAEGRTERYKELKAAEEELVTGHWSNSAAISNTRQEIVNILKNEMLNSLDFPLGGPISGLMKAFQEAHGKPKTFLSRGKDDFDSFVDATIQEIGNLELSSAQGRTALQNKLSDFLEAKRSEQTAQSRSYGKTIAVLALIQAINESHLSDYSKYNEKDKLTAHQGIRRSSQVVDTTDFEYSTAVATTLLVQKMAQLGPKIENYTKNLEQQPKQEGDAARRISLDEAKNAQTLSAEIKTVTDAFLENPELLASCLSKHSQATHEFIDNLPSGLAPNVQTQIKRSACYQQHLAERAQQNALAAEAREKIQ